MREFGGTLRVGHDSRSFYERALFEGTGTQPTSDQTETPIQSKPPLNQLFCKSSEHMDEIPDGTVHLMVTSPPYNVGKDYDEDLSKHDYLELLGNVWRETFRVLVPGGRACINVANLGRKPYIPLNSLIVAEMQDIGFMMRGEVIWNKSASAGVSCAWGSWRSASNPVLRDVHEYIMIFSKSSFKRSDTKGKVSTIQRDEFLEWTKSIWHIPAESARRVKHPAPFPVELPRRLIRLFTFEQDVILDPFIGSGTTAVAAETECRYWLGYDTSKEYLETATNRLNKTISGESPS